MMENLLIQKKIIQCGKGAVPSYTKDTKVKFHYVTRTVGDEAQIIDDSRKHKQPMELIIGKKFKFEPWEECLKSMAPSEISSFTVDKKLTATYPMVSKSLREIFIGKPDNVSSGHCCAMSAMGDKGLGYDDLNMLMNESQPLEFILEIVNIECAGDYEKDAWAMSNDEKSDQVPKLREEGNSLYKEKKYKEAEDKYSQALGLLERLVMQEKPGSDEQRDIELQKIPLLLNYAQCRLISQDWYTVIEHTNSVLKLSPDNVKALYRRAKANAAVWRTTQAQQDYERVNLLDPSLSNKVKCELKQLDNAMREKRAEDRARLEGKLFS